MTEYFLYTTTRDPLAEPLLADLAYEYSTRYADVFRKEPPEMERYPPEAFMPPHGNFVLLLRNGETVGGGAFMRHHDEGTAELKRIWTRRDLRRQGLARRIVAELEAQCARQGYSRVYLTTGFRQPEAVALYLAEGYTALFERPIDPDVPRVLPFEKRLARPGASRDSARPAVTPDAWAAGAQAAP